MRNDKPTQYYKRGPDLKAMGFAPDLLARLEQERQRLGIRALHTIIDSKARTFDELEALGYEGMLKVRSCGVKTAHAIVTVLLDDTQKIAA